MTPRARVIHRTEAGSLHPLLAPGPSDAQRRRIGREEIDARDAAERIIREARVTAETLLAQARVDAASAVVAAAREASQGAQAELAAKWLALRQEELRRIERDAERVVPVAVVLAERLLGAALGLEPARIAELARTVLDEARGARRAVIDAHPLDADALEQNLTTEGLDVQSFEVRRDAALARGDLRLYTDVGTIDARLTPRFERLAAALRDALK